MTALNTTTQARANVPFDSAFDLLGDGRQIEIRTLRPADLPALLAALARVSDESMRRRFFGVRRVYSAAEIAFLTSVDFINHVALVAVIDGKEGPEIIGGGRYVVVKPGMAELAFCIVDAYQRQGIGTALMSRLIAIARSAGLRTLIADILPENRAMLRLCEISGPRMSSRREPGTVQVTLEL